MTSGPAFQTQPGPMRKKLIGPFIFPILIGDQLFCKRRFLRIETKRAKRTESLTIYGESFSFISAAAILNAKFAGFTQARRFVCCAVNFRGGLGSIV